MACNTSMFSLPNYSSNLPSNPGYNTMFNLPNIDVPNNHLPTPQSKNKCVVLSERRFHLNQSKCKFVSVGLAYDFDYNPCIKLSGNKGDMVIFNQDEWKSFLTFQGVLTNYFFSASDVTEPVIDGDKFLLEFGKASYSKFIKIIKNNDYVCLGYETICKLWEYIPLIEYQLDILERMQFPNYFKIVQKGLQCQAGNVFQNALNLLRPKENRNSENVSVVMELLYIYTDIFETECCGNFRG